MLTRFTIIAACAFIGPAALAAPRSCMPNAPYGSAPQWAVEQQSKKTPADHLGADDPIWQHAMCDESRHSVDWRLSGEAESKMVDSQSKTIACVRKALAEMEATQDVHEALVHQTEIELCVTVDPSRQKFLRHALAHQAE
jgi:hypothetical protein